MKNAADAIKSLKDAANVNISVTVGGSKHVSRETNDSTTSNGSSPWQPTRKIMNERPIPEAALRDDDVLEMLRVWIAEKKLHCSMKVGMRRETTNIPEERAWGTILADVTRRISRALETGYTANSVESLAEIRDAFVKELAAPTSDAKDDFIYNH